MKLTVTCIQAEIIPGDPAENTRRARRWLSGVRGAGDHPHFVLLPEYFLGGLTEDGPKLAEPLDGPFGRAMLGCAAERNLHIFAGFPERSPDAQRPYNSIGVWGPGGIVGVYRKTHLYDLGEAHPDYQRETRAFLPGERLGFFEIAGLGVGVMTCADGLVVEVPRALTLMGADVILYPNGRGEVPPEHAEYHAWANGVPIAVCNGWGNVGSERMNGGSRIIGIAGDAVRARVAGPDMISATFDIGAQRRQRGQHWPLLARRPELYSALWRSHTTNAKG